MESYWRSGYVVDVGYPHTGGPLDVVAPNTALPIRDTYATPAISRTPNAAPPLKYDPELALYISKLLSHRNAALGEYTQ